MKVLVACEESQAVTIELRKLGHEAYSNDLLECSGGYPEWHLQKDTLGLIELEWDMIIAFPPCTYLTVTGNRWFNIERYGEKAIQRHKDRDFAINFFKAIHDAKCPLIAIENPVGVMSTNLRKPDQIVNPYQFGDAAEKKTCLWLKGLPHLVATDIVKPPKRTVYASGKTMPSWYADAWKLSPVERAKVRSKTFPGIARAMADQWTSKGEGL
jgi:site-specific DNA-cytosine methylase